MLLKPDGISVGLFSLKKKLKKAARKRACHVLLCDTEKKWKVESGSFAGRFIPKKYSQRDKSMEAAALLSFWPFLEKALYDTLRVYASDIGVKHVDNDRRNLVKMVAEYRKTCGDTLQGPLGKEYFPHHSLVQINRTMNNMHHTNPDLLWTAVDQAVSATIDVLKALEKTGYVKDSLWQDIQQRYQDLQRPDRPDLVFFSGLALEITPVVFETPATWVLISNVPDTTRANPSALHDLIENQLGFGPVSSSVSGTDVKVEFKDSSEAKEAVTAGLIMIRGTKCPVSFYYEQPAPAPQVDVAEYLLFEDLPKDLLVGDKLSKVIDDTTDVLVDRLEFSESYARVYTTSMDAILETPIRYRGSVLKVSKMKPEPPKTSNSSDIKVNLVVENPVSTSAVRTVLEDNLDIDAESLTEIENAGRFFTLRVSKDKLDRFDMAKVKGQKVFAFTDNYIALINIKFVGTGQASVTESDCTQCLTTSLTGIQNLVWISSERAIGCFSDIEAINGLGSTKLIPLPLLSIPSSPPSDTTTSPTSKPQKSQNQDSAPPKESTPQAFEVNGTLAEFESIAGSISISVMSDDLFLVQASSVKTKKAAKNVLSEKYAGNFKEVAPPSLPNDLGLPPTDCFLWSVEVSPVIPVHALKSFQQEMVNLTGDKFARVTSDGRTVVLSEPKYWGFLLCIGDAYQPKGVKYQFEPVIPGDAQVIPIRDKFLANYVSKNAEQFTDIVETFGLSWYTPSQQSVNQLYAVVGSSKPNFTNDPKSTNSPKPPKAFKTKPGYSPSPVPATPPSPSKAFKKGQYKGKEKEKQSTFSPKPKFDAKVQTVTYKPMLLLYQGYQQVNVDMPGCLKEVSKALQNIVRETFTIVSPDSKVMAAMSHHFGRVIGNPEDGQVAAYYSSKNPEKPLKVTVIGPSEEEVATVRKKLNSIKNKMVCRQLDLDLKMEETKEYKNSKVFCLHEGQNIFVCGKPKNVDLAIATIYESQGKEYAKAIKFKPQILAVLVRHFKSLFVRQDECKVTYNLTTGEVLIMGDVTRSAEISQSLLDHQKQVTTTSVVTIELDKDGASMLNKYMTQVFGKNQFEAERVPDGSKSLAGAKKAPTKVTRFKLEVFCLQDEYADKDAALRDVVWTQKRLKVSKPEWEYFKSKESEWTASYTNMVFVAIPGDLVIVKSFSEAQLNGVWEVLKSELQSKVQKTLRVPISEEKYEYLRKCQHIRKLLSSDAQLSSTFAVHKNPQTNQLSAFLEGSSLSCQKAKNDLNEMKIVRRAWDSVKSNLVMTEYFELVTELKEQDIVLDITTPKSSAKLGVAISSTSERDCDDAVKRLNELLITCESWKPDNNADIIRLLKGTNLDELKNELDLSHIQFSTPAYPISLSAKTQQIIDAAKAELTSRANDSKFQSVPFTDCSLLEWDLIQWDDAKKTGFLDICKSHNVSFKIGSNKPYLRGVQSDIFLCCKDLSKFVKSVKREMKIEQMTRPRGEINQLKKNKWRLCGAIQKEIGVYIYTPDESEAPSNGSSQVAFSAKIEGTLIQVVLGSIVEEKTDAIVNAANKNLWHVGGIAGVIAKAAGEDFSRESLDYVIANGSVLPGTAVTTGGGNLLGGRQKVIHTVGPQWTGTGNEPGILEGAVKSAIAEAEKNGCASISIPGISCGIYGGSVEKVAQIMVSTIFSLVNNGELNALNTIRLIDIDEKIVNAFVSEFNKCVTTSTSSPITPPTRPLPKPAHQWYWQEDSGSFKPFDADQNNEIEYAYHHREKTPIVLVTGDQNMQKNGQQYEIDFNKMTEVNTYYRRNYRAIRRVAVPIPNHVIWEVQMPSGWNDLVQSTQIEKEYLAKSFPHVLVNLPDGTQGYLYFDRLVVQRLDGTQLRVKRTEINPAQQFADYATGKPTFKPKPRKLVVTDSATAGKTEDNVTLWLISFDSSALHGAQARYVQAIEKRYTHTSIAEPQGVNQAWRTNLRSLLSNEIPEVKVEFKEGKILLVGFEQELRAATSKVQTILLEHLTAQTTIVEPSTWSAQTQKVQAFEVAQDSDEWNKILTDLRQGIPTATLLRVQRIQHKPLWMKYSYMMKSLKDKNSEELDPMGEKWLWHGTRNTDPKVIWQDEVGLDMRFCAAGFWGRALYFAQNSAYSKAYSHTTPEGHLQMFYVRVLTGVTARVMPRDDSLTKPPMKPTSSDSSLREYYDSVTGETGSGAALSQVYMVYENGRAIPEYLITYSV